MKHPTHEALRRLRLYGMARGLEDLERQPERSKHVVWNGKVFEKGKIVDTICGVGRRENCWQGSGFDHHNFLRWLNDKGRFDERSLGCWWAEWCRCGGRGARGSGKDDKKQKNVNPYSFFWKRKARH